MEDQEPASALLNVLRRASELGVSVDLSTFERFEASLKEMDTLTRGLILNELDRSAETILRIGTQYYD